MSSDSEKEEKKPIVIRNTTDLQRLKLEKLMKHPEKPIIIAERPKERGMPVVPDFVRNVMGSSAGAGSGEFHVYRHLRRKEYARQKYMKERGERDKLEQDYHDKLEENKRKAEERTAKKRAKRLKKKKNQKRKKPNVNNVKTSSSEEENSDSDSETEDVMNSDINDRDKDDSNENTEKVNNISNVNDTCQTIKEADNEAEIENVTEEKGVDSGDNS